MARGIRVIIANSDEEYAIELRSTLLGVEGLKIVAEVEEPALLESAVGQFPTDCVLVNLDPDPEGLIALTGSLLERRHDLSVLAVSGSNDPELILLAMRAGIREFLVRPIDEKHLQDALGRLVRKSPVQGPTGRLICVLGASGGVGATTVAANLACELAQLGQKRTAVVDLDFAFGHIATLLDLSPQFTMGDLCQTLESIDTSMVEKALIRHETGVMALARPRHFSQAEVISAANSANVLNILCDMFQYVVCDGPSRHDVNSASILDLADVTLMVVNLIVPSVRNVDRILQELSRQGYNLDRLQLVVNRQSPDNALLGTEDLEQCLSKKVAFVVPDDPRTVGAAINMGQPLMTFAPRSKVREAIKVIAEAINAPRDKEADKAGAGRKGLLSKVFSR